MKISKLPAGLGGNEYQEGMGTNEGEYPKL